MTVGLAAGCSSGKTAVPPVAGPSAAPAPADGARPPGSSVAPISVASPLGLKWDLVRQDSFAPYLQRLAGGSTFNEVVWCDVVAGGSGQRDWGRADEIVSAGQRFGYTVLLKIRVGSCVDLTGRRGEARGLKARTASLMPTDLAAYRAFVAETVTRYSAQGVHDFAVENEVNGANFWGGTPEEYERLVRVAAEAIRSADPGARVLDNGTSSTAYGAGIAKRLLDQGRGAEAVTAYQAYYERRFPVRGAKLPPARSEQDLRAALDVEQARRNLDYLAVDQRLARDRVTDAHQLHFYEAWRNVPRLLDYLSATFPAGFPVQAWEVGMFWQDAPDDDHLLSDEMLKTTGQLLAGGVRPVIWLPLSFAPGERRDEEIRFGLLATNGTPKPAADAFERLATAARSATASPLRARNGDVTGVSLEAGGRSTLLVWSGAAARLPRLTADVTATDPLGPAVEWRGDGLPVGDRPLLLSGPAGLKSALQLDG